MSSAAATAQDTPETVVDQKPEESNAILTPTSKSTEVETKIDPIKTTVETESPVDESKSDEQVQQTKQVLEGQKAPEKYELKLPEGSHLKADHLEKIVSYAKERGLSNEDAQKLLERENSVVAGFVEDQKQQLKQTTDAWMKEVESDKEIGGTNYKQNVAYANEVVKKFASPQFIKTLNETGLGNHPELVRVFARIGKLMANDKLVVPGTQSIAKKSIEEVFYGASTKGE